MNYEQYEYKIALAHNIELRGWPADLKFQSPSKIMNVPDLIKIRDSLLAKTCRWVKLSHHEAMEFAEKVKQLEADGVITKKIRKGRSDAGMKRKRRTGKDKDEGEDGDGDEDEVQQTGEGGSQDGNSGQEPQGRLHKRRKTVSVNQKDTTHKNARGHGKKAKSFPSREFVGDSGDE